MWWVFPDRITYSKSRCQWIWQKFPEMPRTRNFLKMHSPINLLYMDWKFPVPEIRNLNFLETGISLRDCRENPGERRGIPEDCNPHQNSLKGVIHNFSQYVSAYIGSTLRAIFPNIARNEQNGSIDKMNHLFICICVATLKMPGPISQNGFFFQMMRHHLKYLGFKFHLNRLNRLDTRRDYVFYNCLYLIVYA